VKYIMNLSVIFILMAVSVFAAEMPTEYDVIAIGEVGNENYIGATSPAGHVGGYVYNKGEMVFIYDTVKGYREIEGAESIDVINKDGIAAGKLKRSNYYDSYSVYVYFPDGEIIVISDLPEFKESGLRCSNPISINDQGQVLIEADRDGHFFIFNALTREFDFNVPDGAISINNNGEVLTERGWVNSSGEWIELGSLDRFNRFKVSPEDFNDQGYVVGEGRNSFDEYVGFFYHPKKGMTEVIVEADEVDEMFLKKVNANGRAIGGGEFLSTELDEDGDRIWMDHAVYYDEEHGLIDLGDLGGYFSRAYAINDHGQVVGSSEDEDEDDHAFIWDIDNGMRNLNDYVTREQGWKNLESAHQITNDGVIIGEGNYYGEYHAFIMIPKK